jgi:predicted RNA-binding Zn-ribbon protein involved in translation (DUF1610 family)
MKGINAMDEQTIGYKCPNCDATLEFKASGGTMHRDYCDSDFDVDTLKEYDEALKREKDEEEQGDPTWAGYDNGEWEADGKAIFTCRSCAAELVADENTAATVCPYCGNATILTGRLSGILKPDMVIPFKVEKEQAVEALKKFCKRKPLLPKFFLADHRVESITGIYVPFWLFDADTDSDISYNATRVRSWRQGDYRITETSHFLVRRGGNVGFDRVPVDGSKKMDDAYMEAIEPFHYNEAVDFATAYLSGYLADKYDVDSTTAAPRATARIKESTEDAFRRTVIGYSSVTPRHTSIRLTDNKIHYALMPVWMLNTVYNGKTYTFAMNGQTGKFVGELPVDRLKYWLWTGGIAAAVTLIGAISAFLM